MGKEDLEDYETEIKENLEDITKKIEAAGKLNGPQKKTAMDMIKTNIQKTKHLLKGYVIELKELSTNEQGLYLDREKDFQAQMGKFESDLQWMTTSLQQTAGVVNTPVVDNRKMEDLSAKQLTTHALDVQKESRESALRSKQIVNNTLAVGQETANVLKQQTDQIKQIDRNLDQVESNLKRAEKQVRAYVRRLATDKVIMALLVLLLLGLVGATLSAVLKPSVSNNGTITTNSAFNKNNNVVPPTAGQVIDANT